MNTITDLILEAKSTAKLKGFHEDVEELQKLKDVGFEFKIRALHNSIGMRIALIHSELGEMLEALRQDKIYEVKDCFFEEGADVLIRMFDLFGLFQDMHGFSDDTLEQEVLKKMKVNEGRGYKHGKQF